MMMVVRMHLNSLKSSQKSLQADSGFQMIVLCIQIIRDKFTI
jgi:hypothetical protein